MAQHRSVALRLAIVLIAVVAIAASSDTDTKVAFKRDKVRSLRATQTPPAAAAAPRQQQQQQKQQQQQQEPQYEQQVLVVTGNPTGEKLNEEIRKALRSLLGKEQSDQVQIRELKSEAELRRIAPGARPIGVQLVQ